MGKEETRSIRPGFRNPRKTSQIGKVQLNQSGVNSYYIMHLEATFRVFICKANFAIFLIRSKDSAN